ncbi:MAG: hypothetical protein R2730_05350 [Chitinophagales bacterium]
MSKNAFVFVVCGDDEHINTLNYSIKALRSYSRKDIYVVTDRSRNEVDIEHDNVLDIQTPKEFSNHQASIYLKTGLHKFLPKGNNYCYLDSDIIALSEDCDKIFDEFIPPIRFAPDHCRLPAFSPSAIKCSCYERNEREKAELRALLEKFDLSEQLSGYQKEHHNELLKIIYKVRSKPLRNIKTILKYLFAFNRFNLNDTYYFKRKTRTWHLQETDEPILFDFRLIIKNIERSSTFKWSRLRIAWINEEGKNIFNLTCHHLHEAIQSKFDIKVRKGNWQHWNGGVFLFNDQSHDFLEAWFNKTMEIFKDDNWKTRDQGTLVATAWEFQLQNQPILDKKWNFIADYNNQFLELNPSTGYISDDSFKNKYKPVFIHVYHNFGMKGWEVWDWIEKKLRDTSADNENN